MTREEREELLVERITYITKIALGEELETDKDFNEAILQAAVKFAKVGMKFADEHPDDVRTMAAWQSGYKEAIEKACEWLDCYIDNYLFIDAENKAGIKWDDFINDFRKAMKGE